MIRDLLATSGPWTIPVAVLAPFAALLPARWQRQDSSLRGRIARDLELWRSIPGSWTAREQVRRYVEREIESSPTSTGDGGWRVKLGAWPGLCRPVRYC